MKIGLKHRLYGIILTAVFLIACGVFVGIVIETGIVAWPFLIAAGVFFLLWAGLIFFLAKDSRKKIRSIIAFILALIILLIECFGGYYLILGRNAIHEIVDPEKEYVEIAVYVRDDDPATSVNDIRGYTVGILQKQNRTETDKAVEQISKTLNMSINTVTYSGIEELMDALLDQKYINAIVVNSSFIDLLADIEGHEEDAAKIRKICIINIEVVPEKTDDDKKKDKTGTVFTLYISGIDCFGSVAQVSRSDVNIIATVNTKTRQILLVSTPRDTYMPLSISGDQCDKLTHAGIYGIKVSKNTLERFFDINIDYYFRVNFDGFKNIIDALGGVTVHSDIAFNTADGAHIVKGDNFLNGKQALSFARCRKRLAQGDRQRGRNQMEVIKAVIKKASTPAILTNYKALLNSVTDSFQSDVPYELIASLIQGQMLNSSDWNITTYSVDGTGDSQMTYSLSFPVYVLVPDKATVSTAKSLMEQVRNGQVPKV